MTAEDSHEDRPIWGAKNIGREIDKTERATFHLLSRGELPATKVGASWVTTRRRLRERFAGVAV